MDQPSTSKRHSVLSERKSLNFINSVAMKYRYEQMKLSKMYLQTNRNVINFKPRSSMYTLNKPHIMNIFTKANIKGIVLDKDLKRCQQQLSTLKYERLINGNNISDSFNNNSITKDIYSKEDTNSNSKQLEERKQQKVRTIVEEQNNKLKYKDAMNHLSDEYHLATFENELNDTKLLKQKLKQVHHKQNENVINNNSNNNSRSNVYQHKRSRTVLKERTIKDKYINDNDDSKTKRFFIYKDFKSNKSNLFQQYQPNNFFTKEKSIIMYDKYRNNRKLRLSLQSHKRNIYTYTEDQCKNNSLDNVSLLYNCDSNYNINNITINNKENKGNEIELTLQSQRLSVNDDAERNKENIQGFPAIRNVKKKCDNESGKLLKDRILKRKYKEINKRNLENIRKRYDKKCVSNIINCSNEMERIGCKISKVLDDVSDYFSEKIDKVVEIGLESYS